MFGIGVPLNVILAKIDIGIDPVEGGDIGYIAKSLIPLKTASQITKKDLQPAAPKFPSQQPDQNPDKQQKPNGNGKPGSKKLPVKKKVNTKQDGESEALRLATENLESLYQQKMGKFLKEMRTNAFHHPNPEDPARYEFGISKWRRWIAPVQLLSLVIGRKNGTIHPNHMSLESLKDMTHKIQTTLDSASITDKYIDNSLNTLMDKSGLIVNTIIQRLSRADSNNWNSDVKSIFEDMNILVPEWSSLFIRRGIKLGKENRAELE
jgi:hypothetical protein